MRATLPGGGIADRTYDSNGRVVSAKSFRVSEGAPVEDAVSIDYDAKGRPIEITDARGGTTLHEYDAIGRRTLTVDPAGGRTTFTYLPTGQLGSVEFPDGSSQAHTYDLEGRRLTETGRSGQTTAFEHDALGRVVRIVRPDGSVLRTEFDAVGKVAAQIDPAGHRTEYEYDAAGRLTKITDPLGGTVTNAYDEAGQLISTTDPLGRTSTFTYDAAGRRTRTTFADRTFITATYYAAGEIRSVTDELGRTTEFDYDPLGRLTRTIDPLAQATVFAYDGAGNRISRTDASGRMTRFVYGAGGALDRRELPLGQIESFGRDVLGRVTSLQDPNGESFAFAYDELGRLVRKTLPDSSVVEFTYNPDGTRATAVDARGAIAYGYDALGRLVSTSNPDGSSITYSYDPRGPVASVSAPSGTTLYEYDALARPARVVDPEGGVTTYAYDAASNLIEAVRPNGVKSTYTYDLRNRLISLEHRSSVNALLDRFDYTLDPTGKRTRVVESSGRQVEYTFDAAGRLTEEKITDPLHGNETLSFAYDAVGNRLFRTSSVSGITSYAYDANDRMLAAGAESFSYDANGNTLGRSGVGAPTVLEYDSENRLIAVERAGMLSSYDYDADGARIAATVDGATTSFLVDKNRRISAVLEDRDGAGALLARYTQGIGLLSQRRGSEVTYPLADGARSTRALTDAGGATTDTCDYDAFGLLRDHVGASPNPYLYDGERLDAETGLYHLRARQYDPAVGRFVTRDPLGGVDERPLSLNPYLYADGDPVNGSDPLGLLSSIENATAITIISIISVNVLQLLVGGSWALGALLGVPEDGFLEYPSALLGGVSTSGFLKSKVKDPRFQAAFFLSTDAEGIDFLVRPIQAAAFPYFGFSVGGAIVPSTDPKALHAGLAYRVNSLNDYLGPFYVAALSGVGSVTASGAFNARFGRKNPLIQLAVVAAAVPGLSVFAGPAAKDGTARSYGFSVQAKIPGLSQVSGGYTAYLGYLALGDNLNGPPPPLPLAANFDYKKSLDFIRNVIPTNTADH